MKRNMRLLRNNKKLIIIGAAFFLFLFLCILLNKEIIALRYEIARQEEELKKEKEIERALMIEIETLKRPERIEELARSYGLISIKPKKIVFLPDVIIEEQKRGKPQEFFARIFRAEARTR